MNEISKDVSEDTLNENEVFCTSINNVLDEVSKVGKLYNRLTTLEDDNKKLKKHCDFYKKRLKTADKLIRNLQECVVPAQNYEDLQKSYNETKVELNNIINRHHQEQQSLCAQVEELKQKLKKSKHETLIKSVKVKKCEGHIDTILQLELEKDELVKINEDLNQRCRSLQEKHDESLIQAEELQRSMKELFAVKINNKVLLNEQNQFKDDIQSLRVELENYKLKNCELTQTVEKQSNDIKYFKQQVEICENKLNSVFANNVDVFSKSEIESENLEPSLGQSNENFDLDFVSTEIVRSRTFIVMDKLQYKKDCDMENANDDADEVSSVIVEEALNDIKKYRRNLISPLISDRRISVDFNFNKSEAKIKEMAGKAGDTRNEDLKMLVTLAKTMQNPPEKSSDDIKVVKEEIKEAKEELKFVKGEVRETKDELKFVKSEIRDAKGELLLIKGEKKVKKEKLNSRKEFLETVNMQLRIIQEKKASETIECQRIHQEVQSAASDLNKVKEDLKLKQEQLRLCENSRVMEERVNTMEQRVQAAEKKLLMQLFRRRKGLLHRNLQLESQIRKKMRLLSRRNFAERRIMIHSIKKVKKQINRRRPSMKPKRKIQNKKPESSYEDNIKDGEQSDHGSIETIYEKSQKSVDSGYMVSDGEFEGYKTPDVEDKLPSEKCTNCTLLRTSSIENMEIELSSVVKLHNEQVVNQNNHIPTNNLLINAKEKLTDLAEIQQLNNSIIVDSEEVIKEDNVQQDVAFTGEQIFEISNDILQLQPLDDGISSNEKDLINNKNIVQDFPYKKMQVFGELSITTTSEMEMCNKLRPSNKRSLCNAEIKTENETIGKKKCVDERFGTEPVNNVDKIQIDTKNAVEELKFDLVKNETLPKCKDEIRTNHIKSVTEELEKVSSEGLINQNFLKNDIYSQSDYFKLEPSTIYSSDKLINNPNEETREEICLDDLFNSEPIHLQTPTKVQSGNEIEIQNCSNSTTRSAVEDVMNELFGFESAETHPNSVNLNSSVFSFNNSHGALEENNTRELEIEPTYHSTIAAKELMSENKIKSTRSCKKSGISKAKSSTKNTTNRLYDLSKLRKICEGRSLIKEAPPVVEKITLNSLTSSKTEDVSNFTSITQKKKRVAHEPKKVNMGSTDVLPMSPRRSVRINNIAKDSNNVIKKTYKRPLCRKNNNVLSNLLDGIGDNLIKNQENIEDLKIVMPNLAFEAFQKKYESPASPEWQQETNVNEDVINWSPKIIPLELVREEEGNENGSNSLNNIIVQTVKLNPKEFLKLKENCKELILQLFDSPCFPMVQRVSNILSKYNQPNMIARLIVETSVQDSESGLFMKFENGRAPQISQIQFILLQLLFEFRGKKYDSIITNFLEIAEQTILSARSAVILAPIARLHTAFLKATVNYKRVKPMIFIALARMGKFSIEYINIICTSWPDIFSPFDQLSGHRQLIARGMIKAISLKPTTRCYLSLRAVLHHSYSYPLENESTETLLEELFKAYTETRFEELKIIILILGISLKPKPFFKLVGLKLKPIIQNASNETYTCAAINLLGFLLHELSCNEIEDVRSKYVEWLILFSKGGVPNVVTEECTSVVNVISKL